MNRRERRSISRYAKKFEKQLVSKAKKEASKDLYKEYLNEKGIRNEF